MGEIKRFKRTNKFGQIYEILCCQKSVSPLAPIRAHLTEDRLKFCCDRVDLEDWSPILNSLAADRSLLEIEVYSRHRPKRVDETVDTEEKLDEYRRSRRTTCRAPIVYTNFLLRCIVDAVAVCAKNSSVLTSLSLDGIPLADSRYLDILCAGLAGNRGLKSISLARCRIGDGGCSVLLRAILNDADLQLVNLTACSLTSDSAEFISSFLRKKRAKLLADVWRQSAIGCAEAGRSSAGLETLVLDGNRRFGDDGLVELTRVLKDDFWLKELSLRRCGLTKIGGESVVDLLETNSVLVGLNLGNNDVPVEIVRAVRRLLKRRLENGERTPLKRRLIDRKDLDRRNRKFRDKRAMKRRKMKIVISNGRASMVRTGEEAETNGPNLKQLNERLTTAIDGNRDLMLSLANRRRLENDARTPLKRRLIDRKDLHRRNRKSRDKRAMKRRKMKIVISNGRASKVRTGEEAETNGPNLNQLNERLTTAIDGNRDLMVSLANQRQLLLREKHSRITAERSYQLLRPIIEKLWRGARRHNGAGCRILLESQLCSDLRQIFRGLESISENSRSGEHREGFGNSAERNLVDGSFGVDKKITVGAQKRPFCPPRQKL